MKNLTILLLLVATITVNAADIVVNGSGLAGTYTTISAAVQAANEGDKILVSNQAFPYQEDTLFINKGVTILPYSDITHIDFEGDIMITLDSISELTLIGFNSDNTDILSVFNDTSRNSLSTINIVDCDFADIYLDQTKTSLYLSYSTVNHVRFSHGDIIANSFSGGLYFGIQSWSSNWSSNSTYISRFNNFLNMSTNNLNNGSNMSTCDLFNNIIRFGNVPTYSDTCNIIANDFNWSYIHFYSSDFAYNFKNNQATGYSINVSLSCPTSIGTNQIINNDLRNSGNSYYAIQYNLAYCSSASPSFNFSDVTLRMLNNTCGYPLRLDAPDNASASTYAPSNLSIISQGLISYNQGGYVHNDGGTNLENIMFNIGPSNSSNNNPNPSAEFLNLDLTPNATGKDGGSDAWDNYNPNGNVGFGTMTGSKARITYLNLPTQIFDPSNIQIKAKAVHGN